MSSRSKFWTTSETVWFWMTSSQASTPPNMRSRSTTMVSWSLLSARVVARLTASVVQPTPPDAPVTVTIRAPSAMAVCDSLRPRMQPGDGLEQLGRLGRQRRNSRARRRTALKINPLSAARLAGRTIESGLACVSFWMSSMAWFGSWSSVTIVKWAMISLARDAASW